MSSQVFTYLTFIIVALYALMVVVLAELVLMKRMILKHICGWQDQFMILNKKYFEEQKNTNREF